MKTQEAIGNPRSNTSQISSGVYVYISVGQNYSHTLTHPLFSPVLKEKDTFESRETLKEAPICPERETAEKGSGCERKGAKEGGRASPALTRPLGETLSPPDLHRGLPEAAAPTGGRDSS